MKKCILILFCALLCMSCFTGCVLLDTVKDTVENGSYVKDYKKDVKNIYDNSEAASMIALIPSENFSTYADTSSSAIEQNVYTDDFDNQVTVELYPSQNTNKCILIAQILIDEKTYKDNLNVIIKDTKSIIDTYKDKCEKILAIGVNSSTSTIEWYTRIDFEDKEDDLTLIAIKDYVSYLNSIIDMDIEENEYWYTCEIPIDLYDLDIYNELDGVNEFTASDIQRKNAGEINSNILDTIEYLTYNYDLKYEIYPKDNNLTIIMYPKGENKLDKNDIDILSISDLFTSTYNSAKDYYDDVIIILRESKDDDVIYETRNDEVTVDEIS